MHHSQSRATLACMYFLEADPILCRRIDEPILQHMETESLEFLQFSFRQACFPSPQFPINGDLKPEKDISKTRPVFPNHLAAYPWFFRARGIHCILQKMIDELAYDVVYDFTAWDDGKKKHAQPSSWLSKTSLRALQIIAAPKLLHYKLKKETSKSWQPRCDWDDFVGGSTAYFCARCHS